MFTAAEPETAVCCGQVGLILLKTQALRFLRAQRNGRPGSPEAQMGIPPGSAIPPGFIWSKVTPVADIQRLLRENRKPSASRRRRCRRIAGHGKPQNLSPTTRCWFQPAVKPTSLQTLILIEKPMKTLITASLIAFASASTVSVQAAGDHAPAAMAAPAAEMQMVDGQVKKVDKGRWQGDLVNGLLTNLEYFQR